MIFTLFSNKPYQWKITKTTKKLIPENSYLVQFRSGINLIFIFKILRLKVILKIEKFLGIDPTNDPSNTEKWPVLDAYVANDMQ